jgi:hypothetical protein
MCNGSCLSNVYLILLHGMNDIKVSHILYPINLVDRGGWPASCPAPVFPGKELMIPVVKRNYLAQADCGYQTCNQSLR